MKWRKNCSLAGRSLSPKLAERVRDGLLSRASWSIMLLDAITAGTLPKTTLTQTDVQRLTDLPDEGVRSRAIKLLEFMAGSSRDEVIRTYQVALTLKGDREKGAALFKQNCSACHQIGTVGNQVGPKLGDDEESRPRGDPDKRAGSEWRSESSVARLRRCHRRRHNSQRGTRCGVRWQPDSALSRV